LKPVNVSKILNGQPDAQLGRRIRQGREKSDMVTPRLVDRAQSHPGATAVSKQKIVTGLAAPGLLKFSIRRVAEMAPW
jgi:hypothetical protein